LDSLVEEHRVYRNNLLAERPNDCYQHAPAAGVVRLRSAGDQMRIECFQGQECRETGPCISGCSGAGLGQH
jgi:hypothetical protein